MASGSPGVLAHRTTRGGRWLRERRIRFALWIALIEGLLIVVGVIPVSLAIVVAVATVLAYFAVRDRIDSDTGRQGLWIAAGSQAIVVTVPILLAVAGIVALIVLALIGIVALLVLLGDRR
jgi:hypothetical protein